MAQIFSPRTDRLVRLVAIAALVAIIAAIWALLAWRASPQVTGVGVERPQPVRFSHELHAGRLGIDCRYCHVGVDRTASAGLPTTETCMTCHSQIWRDAPDLAPVQDSHDSGEPLVWSRIHRLPDHSRFHHAIHLDKGVACETCHGRVDQMRTTTQVVDMTMAWCLDCHRNPADHIRPPEGVFAFGWDGPAPPGEALVEAYGIDAERLSDCALCHY